MAVKQLNKPIEEPYQGRELTRREKARKEKWPDMRFCEASIYPVGTVDQCPQFEAHMDKNEAYVLLVHPKESTTYCKQEEAHLFTNRTMALLGEPIEGFRERQKAWQEFDERSRSQPFTDERGLEVTRTGGDPVDAETYIQSSGEKT